MADAQGRDDDDDDLRGDDAGLDDDQLRQLRTVWVAMRDEAPSDRGLNALMAAARSQAAQMRPAPWWRQLLTTLRRPPMLALATVVVLIGGAVVVSQREELRSEAQEAPEALVAERLDDRQAAEAGSSSPDLGQPAAAQQELSPAQVAAPVAEPVPNSIAPRSSSTPGGTVGAARPVVVAKPRPARPAPDPEPVAERKPAGAGVTSQVQKDSGAGTATQTLSIANDDGAAVTDQVTVTAPTSRPTRAPQRRPAPPIEGDMASPAPAAPPPPPPTIAQLVKQCETAAARGDCAAARRFAAQIERADPAAFRARIAKNSTIARCLAD